MKKTDFDNFKFSLNVNIEIDSHIRKIMEKVKILNQFRDNAGLTAISLLLSEIDAKLDDAITSNHCTDDTDNKA